MIVEKYPLQMTTVFTFNDLGTVITPPEMHQDVEKGASIIPAQQTC